MIITHPESNIPRIGFIVILEHVRRSKLSFSSDVEQKQALKSDAENGLMRTVSKEFTPPDGGWGWVVCFTSMLCNGTVFSIMNTFGILYTFLLDEYAAGDSEISLKTSFVGSVSTGLTFLMSIVSSILSDRVGIRQTAFVGTLFGLVGLVSSAFVTELELLYLTFGVFLGIGAGLIYSPSLTILGHYFDKHMGLVNGIVAFGSSLFSIILSIALPYLLKGIQVKYTFIVLAGMYLILVFCTLTWKPLIPKQSNLAALTLSKESVVEHVNDCCAFAKTFLNTKIFKNKAYVIWAVSLGLSLFGYFVPFVHLVSIL
ncbi:SLC16A10 [Mytilus edulis]|uniref:SLC16A10 n=1 Tax=Mytilus edulis TaxID=6550 RepID=A0A8S3S9D2_MYTED|nr:SLC16A10 [Mytilus edulis]